MRAAAAPYPDHAELKLSTAFKDADALRENKTFPLELTVQVYNINHGRNPEMLIKSENLHGYSFLIEKIREYERTISEKEKAMTNAIKFCINHGILKEFLETHSSEVFNMLLTEWNTEDAIAVRAEEAWEEGHERGLEEGLGEGREEREIEIAQNALAKGLTIEFVHEITGLDLETVEKLKAEMQA